MGGLDQEQDQTRPGFLLVWSGRLQLVDPVMIGHSKLCDLIRWDGCILEKGGGDIAF